MLQLCQCVSGPVSTFACGKKLNEKLAEKYPPKRYIEAADTGLQAAGRGNPLREKGCLMKGHKKGLAVWIAAVLVLLEIGRAHV